MELFSASLELATASGAGAAAALLAGLTSSAHCALMCGPLACAAAAPAAGERLVPLERRARGGARTAAFTYHLGRIGAYAAVGAALGTAGEGARRLFTSIAPVLPWVMAGALVSTAFGWGKRIPVPAGLRRLAQPLLRKSARLAPAARAAAIGAGTPLLPCGILYGLFLAAVAASSAGAGAGLMAAFALGATPALSLVQVHSPLLARFPRALALSRRLVPLLAAFVLVWRAFHAGSPSCH
jgi:sulfite exporter TauE/SafE